MPNGINKAIIVGRLGVDPETRFTAGGNPVTNLRLATSESWKDKQTGEQKENTEWHRIVMFGKLAEIAGEYLEKGSQCFIEGRIQTRKWQDNDGNDRWTTEIVAHQMTMLGKSGGGQDQGSAPESGGGQGDQPATPEDFDDRDVPF